VFVYRARIKVILDERVLRNERVYSGGGGERHLLLISPSEIVRDGAIVARIRK
jgi:prolyl-tRNA editing enzyme YbaK/EbsC (Cys-tRNA(Pro) deacylase)